MRKLYILFFIHFVTYSFAQKVLDKPITTSTIVADKKSNSSSLWDGWDCLDVSDCWKIIEDNITPPFEGGVGNGDAPVPNPNDPIANENYIRTIECLKEDCSNRKETVVYYDGLGREKQALQVAASLKGNTIVTPFEYDGFGRQAKEFLPFPIASSDNKISTAADGSSFYSTLTGDTTPYSEKTFEDSPLNRVLFQAAPGESWKKGAGHEIGFSYETNTNSDVLRFDVSLDTNYVPTLVENGKYSAGTLYKTVTTDENKQAIQEFKDKEGRIILKRIDIPAISGNSSGEHDTYYVYDVYGNLTFVLPPKLIEVKDYKNNLEELGYQYQYDEKNRLVEKQLPGKGKEYMVYDKQDRLTLQQDANQRNSDNKGWTFFKYDKLGRIVYTGFFKNSATRAAMQKALNNKKTPNNEERTTTVYTNNGASIYYTNTQFPNGSLTVQTVNYYDNYENLDINPSTIDGQSVIGKNDARTKGLAVATFTNVLETETWNKSYIFYDDKYLRPIASRTDNYLGGYQITASNIDFRGKVLNTITKHKRTSSSEEITVKETLDYYENELLKTHTHQVNNNPVEYLTQNSYNEINQLTTKKVGNNNASAPLQNVDYKYNIRGWLTDINDVDKNNSLFSFKIGYDKVSNSPNKLYNGNIAETTWSTSNNNDVKAYTYNYDGLNRLIKADFINITKNKSNIYSYDHTYDEKIKGYDHNGNILGIDRNGNKEDKLNTIDDLTYRYKTNSNKLLSVTDALAEKEGFDDGNKSGDDYAYDANGNLIKDLNKGISQIKYNYLNLPTEVLWNASKKINYTYDASGVKLRKVVTNGTVVTTTDYTNGFQYVSNGKEDSKLQFFPTAEGYVNVTDGNKFNYVYNYTDHLGNVRLSYQSDTNGSLKILEENNYYPFGLKHSGYTATTIGNKNYNYKYQGQERQDEFGLNWDSFKWRNYDVAIGRFFNIDPLAEKYVDWAPYVFSGNRVIDAIELEGLEPRLLSPGVYEWRVNVQTGDKFDSNYVKNLLQEVSSILSQNENLTVSIVQDKEASYTIDMTGKNIGKVREIDGEYTIVGGIAPLGKLADVTISSDGTVVSTAHEMAHSAKEDHVGSANSSVQDTKENENNLMQPKHSGSSTNTKLTDEQTKKMDTHMNFYQQFLDKKPNE